VCVHALGYGQYLYVELDRYRYPTKRMFIPMTIRPSFAGASSTGAAYRQLCMIAVWDDIQADLLLVLNARPVE